MAPKTLSRLSRSSLIALALKWLDNPALFQKPYLACNRDAMEEEEEDYLYTPAEDVETLRQIYMDLEDANEMSKRDIINRMVEGDWRRGLSLHQLAMIDLQHIEENDTCLRWSALKLVPLDSEDDTDEQPAKKRAHLSDDQEKFPRIQAATFLKSLKAEISPLVKAHYYLHRLPPPYNLSILRLYITGTLFTNPKASTQSHAPDGSRSLYIALPDSCPYVYIAVSGLSSGGSERRKKSLPKPDIASMKRTILEAIPKAFSRPQARYALTTTNMIARSLRAMCEMRGTGRAENSAGAFSSFAEAVVDQSPLDPRLERERPADSVEQEVDTEQANRNAMVQARFGSGLKNVALDRLHVKIEDSTVSSKSRKRKRTSKTVEQNDDAAPMSIQFSGSDVFAGIRKLAALGDGLIDLDEMPSWMTGEDGLTNLTV